MTRPLINDLVDKVVRLRDWTGDHVVYVTHYDAWSVEFEMDDGTVLETTRHKFANRLVEIIDTEGPVA